MTTSSKPEPAVDRSAEDDRAPFAWYFTLGRKGGKAFTGAFLGYGLDSYDFWVLPLGLVAIAAGFDLGAAQTGLLATTTLVCSANPGPGPAGTIFGGGLLLFAMLLATGVQGGYHTPATWVPTYLQTERGLSVIGTGGHLTFLVTGAFCGYLTGGFFPTLIGFLVTSYSVGGAMAFGAMAYGLAAVALLGLPEARARQLS